MGDRLEKYRRMQRAGLPQGAIENAMVRDSIDPHELFPDAALSLPKGPPAIPKASAPSAAPRAAPKPPPTAAGGGGGGGMLQGLEGFDKSKLKKAPPPPPPQASSASSAGGAESSTPANPMLAMIQAKAAARQQRVETTGTSLSGDKDPALNKSTTQEPPWANLKKSQPVAEQPKPKPPPPPIQQSTFNQESSSQQQQQTTPNRSTLKPATRVASARSLAKMQQGNDSPEKQPEWAKKAHATTQNSSQQKADVSCDRFTLNLSGGFGECKCGWPKADHTDSRRKEILASSSSSSKQHDSFDDDHYDIPTNSSATQSKAVEVTREAPSIPAPPIQAVPAPVAAPAPAPIAVPVVPPKPTATPAVPARPTMKTGSSSRSIPAVPEPKVEPPPTRKATPEDIARYAKMLKEGESRDKIKQDIIKENFDPIDVFAEIAIAMAQSSQAAEIAAPATPTPPPAAPAIQSPAVAAAAAASNANRRSGSRPPPPPAIPAVAAPQAQAPPRTAPPPPTPHNVSVPPAQEAPKLPPRTAPAPPPAAYSDVPQPSYPSAAPAVPFRAAPPPPTAAAPSFSSAPPPPPRTAPAPPPPPRSAPPPPGQIPQVTGAPPPPPRAVPPPPAQKAYNPFDM